MPNNSTRGERYSTRSEGGAPAGVTLDEFPDRLSLEPERSRRLFRKLTAGVSVVSALGAAGPVGLTVSAVTSVSLRPPLLLVCLAAQSTTLRAIERNRSFAVQLLTEDQRAVAEDFASPTGRRFAGHDHRYIAGVPVLDRALAWSVCLLSDARRYGDHVVVIGEIVAAHTGSGRPLVWHGQRFGNLSA
ncbi:flavin reductase family protein [Nocardia sp. CDC153]|uniref:flavin reductase family protein n=1 Tax=Nocardia sp. CDC153 TaxID=3112167 RepID=UPI002DBE9789|nr:flavin reductase family protein [Nocardia sp. CDC153]MEC3956871.1 flavin reductase family protein [Nocardia sp. CDC153]